MSYTAKSLADIAEMFERMGERADERRESLERRLGSKYPQRDRLVMLAEARTWCEAGRILRETTIQ